jgi:excisionase family DNA binding protein
MLEQPYPMSSSTADAVRIQPLLLTPKEAAKALSISDRTLWALTDRGEIPVMRIGRSVRYDPRSLSRWIEENQSATVVEPEAGELAAAH